jgi:hypothetical protein
MSQDEKDMKEEPIVICPHCNDFIIIKKINCAIFRHGIFKKTGKQIDPHSSKELCDYYIRENKIYGCGKPFIIIKKDDKFLTEICDYI